MNTISTLPAAQMDKQVAAQELELKGLLARVMEAPLAPLVEHLGRIDERLDELEEICRESRDLGNGVHADMVEQKVATERSLRSLQKSSEEVRTALQHDLAGISGGVAKLCKTMGDVDGRLGKVYTLQRAQDGTLTEFSSAFGAIDDELKRTTTCVEAVVPAQQVNAQQLKEELLQLHEQHRGQLDSMQQAFQRRFTLLTLACGFSLVANIVLLVSFQR